MSSETGREKFEVAKRRLAAAREALLDAASLLRDLGAMS